MQQIMSLFKLYPSVCNCASFAHSSAIFERVATHYELKNEPLLNKRCINFAIKNKV